MQQSKIGGVLNHDSGGKKDIYFPNLINSSLKELCKHEDKVEAGVHDDPINSLYTIGSIGTNLQIVFLSSYK